MSTAFTIDMSFCGCSDEAAALEDCIQDELGECIQDELNENINPEIT